MLEREFILRTFVVQESQQDDPSALMCIQMVCIHNMLLSTESLEKL